MTKDTKKYQWIDIMRALLIVMIVVGHVGLRYFGGFFYLFHVAAFFVLSGYLSDFGKYGFREYLINKAKRLLVPLVVVNLLFYFLIYILQALGISYYFYDIQINSFYWIRLFTTGITTDLGGATWFLLILFFSSIISYIVIAGIALGKKKAERNYFQIFCAAIIILMIGYGILGRVIMPFNADLAIFGTGFMLLGYGIRARFGLIANPKTSAKTFMFMLLCGSLLLVFYYFSLPVDWAVRRLNNIVTDSLQVALGTAMTAVAAIYLSKTKMISKFFIRIGQSTITILLFHFLIFRVLFAVFYKFGLVVPEQLRFLTPKTIDNQLLLLVIALLTIVICVVLDNFLERYKITRRLILGNG